MEELYQDFCKLHFSIEEAFYKASIQTNHNEWVVCLSEDIRNMSDDLKYKIKSYRDSAYEIERLSKDRIDDLLATKMVEMLIEELACRNECPSGKSCSSQVSGIKCYCCWRNTIKEIATKRLEAL